MRRVDVVLTQEFEDSFGTPATDYPSKTTINAKFVSFDDQAFTLNCKTGKDFYQNLGIGNQSFPKINMPSGCGFDISGLTWYFFDINVPEFQFEKKGAGIYDQLLRQLQASVQSTRSICQPCIEYEDYMR